MARSHEERTVEAVLEGVDVAPLEKTSSKVSKERSLRQALLCKARSRMQKRKEVKLQGGGIKDGVELRFAGTVPCNGVDTPLLFANWSLKGVKAIHVFSALAHTKKQKWNTDLVKADVLKVYTQPQVQATGVKLEYAAGKPFSNRKVYEWETYDRNEKGTEYWFVASSDHNKELTDLDTDKAGSSFFGFGGGTVEADSCLSAHRFRETEDGIEAVFTNTVNGHPPFGISAEFVSKLTWGKTVDFVTTLKKRALELAQQDESQLWLPSPQLLPTNVTTECSSTSMLGKAWKELDAIVEKDQLLPLRINMHGDDASWVPRDRAAVGGALLGVSLLALVAFRAWSRPRYASLSEPVATLADHVVSTDTEAPADSIA